MRVHFIIHESFEAPGIYLDWANQHHQVSMTKCYENQALPQSIDDLDMLIVMGGPQSPQTTKEECPHFDSAAEMELIQRFVAANKPVIGVCLGAQLLGQSYGAQVQSSPQKEIGNFPIHLTTAGLEDEKLSSFKPNLVVGHWHGDMPGLTENAQVLAESQGCPRQIVKYSDKHYGFQCHLEFKKEMVEALLAQEADYEQSVASHPFVQEAEAILSYDYSEMNQALVSFLDHFNA